MNYTEMLFNRDERLVNLLNQADNKNLELIEEINNREDEIERLQRQKEELQVNGLRQETLFKLEIERLNKERNKLYENGLNDFLELQKKRVENKRLNNIINELEKYINEDDWTSVNGEIAVRLIKLKLQELKGSDKE